MSTIADGNRAVIEHFDRFAATRNWSRLYGEANGRNYHFHVRQQRVMDLLPQKLGRVVDLGCGPGVMVEAVLERGGAFDGIDLSPEMVREAIDKYGSRKGVTFREGNCERVELPESDCDQVIAMGLIEYLLTPDTAFSEISRILRPGGTAIITMPKLWHVDRAAIGMTAPFRLIARAIGAGSADSLPRLCLQPAEMDTAARRAGLVPDGGSHYDFTMLPYPFTRVAPDLAMRFNMRFERWHSTRSALKSYFAHGYVGRYRKPS